MLKLLAEPMLWYATWQTIHAEASSVRIEAWLKRSFACYKMLRMRRPCSMLMDKFCIMTAVTICHWSVKEPMNHCSFLPRNGLTMLSPMSFTNLEPTMVAMRGLVPLPSMCNTRIALLPLWRSSNILATYCKTTQLTQQMQPAAIKRCFLSCTLLQPCVACSRAPYCNEVLLLPSRSAGLHTLACSSWPRTLQGHSCQACNTGGAQVSSLVRA